MASRTSSHRGPLGATCPPTSSCFLLLGLIHVLLSLSACAAGALKTPAGRDLGQALEPAGAFEALAASPLSSTSVASAVLPARVNVRAGGEEASRAPAFFAPEPPVLSFSEKRAKAAKGWTSAQHAPPNLECKIFFEGPVSQPPVISLTASSSSFDGPYLLILRDRDPRANGWIHGYQRGVHVGYSGAFGAGDEGEYVQCHPGAGSHIYDLLVFDRDYRLGSRLQPLVSTPWNNGARALGPEKVLIDDLSEDLPPDAPRPRILTRCSVSVSHAQVEAEERQLTSQARAE
ncbi:hypothetical protein BESB_019910 [Besnoitia besnoiti]|uniref:Uncharacterized protein n=1 Tax=Besnoitia besnoiti TaxID=94643 RepID=A0A2A9M9I9_BESBE|nr:hypothetical protein BESB_019910 [Besnoitia besnoiti]PFH32050.1 hypothetical protein BESB_019910 [Besnoitia besnoiti]